MSTSLTGAIGLCFEIPVRNGEPVCAVMVHIEQDLRFSNTKDILAMVKDYFYTKNMKSHLDAVIPKIVSTLNSSIFQTHKKVCDKLLCYL